jgi:hypothetical protein
VNELTVKGPKAELDKFLKAAKAGKTPDANATALSLNKLVPIPKGKEDQWYDWNITNWGTKWDIEAGADRISPSHAHFGFNSAWAPPIDAFDKISKMFPKLSFELTYDEPGMCFEGDILWKKGERAKESQREDDEYTGCLCGHPDMDEDEEA